LTVCAAAGIDTPDHASKHTKLHSTADFRTFGAIVASLFHRNHCRIL
jgi:hypothetical protein